MAFFSEIRNLMDFFKKERKKRNMVNYTIQRYIDSFEQSEKCMLLDLKTLPENEQKEIKRVLREVCKKHSLCTEEQIDQKIAHLFSVKYNDLKNDQLYLPLTLDSGKYSEDITVRISVKLTYKMNFDYYGYTYQVNTYKGA